MKQKNIFLLLFLLTMMGACKQKKSDLPVLSDVEKNHLQRNNIYGQVQTMTTTYYSLSKNKQLTEKERETKISENIQQYNQNGYLESVISIKVNGDTAHNQWITYLPNSNKTDFWVDGDIRNSFEYNMAKHLSAEKIYQNDTLVMATYYKSDALGNVMEIMQDYGQYQLRNVFSYDDRKLIERIDEYDPNQKLFKYVTIEYDNAGREINRRAFRSGDKLIEFTFFQYGKQGELLKKVFENKANNVKETSVYSEHDQYGNWTKEVLQKNEQETYIRKRTIIYY